MESLSLGEILQRCTDGCAELAVLRYVEVYTIEAFACGKHLLAQREFRQFAYHHEVLDATIHRREDGSTADALQHSPEDAQGNVFTRSIALRIAEE